MDLFNKKKIKTMNIKKATNSQLSTTESKKKLKTKQTTRTGTESQVWGSFGGLSVGWGKGGECAGIKKHNWQV